jgi:nucleotide-binding universal stress UspA family protein
LINQILVCLEGSPSGQRALDLGIAIARRQHAQLAGLAVIDEPDIRAGAASGIGGSSYKKQRDDALLEDAQRQAREWLTAFHARCAAAGVQGKMLEERGRPAATIIEQMEHHDLTLMGRHANFRFETAASDAETRDRILHHTRRPVLVVPEEAPPASGKIMVAFDGSSAAKRAVRSFAESGLAQDRALSVVCVDDDGATAWELASRGVELLREFGLSAAVENVVSVLPIADALLETRARLGAELLVMGAYTTSRLSELIWGSVTRELVEKTAVPLYLHH